MKKARASALMREVVTFFSMVYGVLETFGTLGEIFCSVSLAIILKRLSGAERVENDSTLQWRENLFFFGVCSIAYSLPFTLLSLGIVGAWILAVLSSLLILRVITYALSFFRLPDHPDFAGFEGSFQGIRQNPEIGLMLWLARYFNISIFFWGLFAALNVLSCGTSFKMPKDVMPSLLDLLYFSFMTTTTLGYSDVIPSSGLAKGLTVAEVLSGMLILVLCVSVAIQHNSSEWGKSVTRNKGMDKTDS